MGLVAAEQLIPAGAIQHYLDVSPGHLSQRLEADRRGVVDRLVGMINKCLVVPPPVLGIDDQLVVPGAEMLRGPPRRLKLVVAGGDVITDRVRDHAARLAGAHQGQHGRRVDAPAQEQAQRHIGAQVQADGLVQQGARPFHRLLRRGGNRLRRLRVVIGIRPLPEAAGLDRPRPRVHHQVVAGQQAADAGEERALAQHVAKAEVGVQHSRVKRRLHAGIDQQGLGLAGEEQPPVALRQV